MGRQNSTIKCFVTCRYVNEIGFLRLKKSLSVFPKRTKEEFTLGLL